MSINIESSFSFSGSLIKKDSLNGIKEKGYKALGLVDTTTSFFFDFYSEMKKQDIKPLLGLRIKGHYFDYILYSKNHEGYKEILKYNSNRSKLDYLNSLDDLLISNNILYVLDVTYLENDNLLILNKEYNELSKNNVDVYVGVDFNYYPCEIVLYPLIENQYKCILINKVKYINEDDKKASDVLEAILNNTELREANLFDIGKVSSNYLRDSSELLNQYKDYKKLINNTLDFIDLVDINIEFNYHFPKYQTRNNVPSDIYLKALSNKGLNKRLENTTKDKKKYKERLNYELDVIHSMGFDDYFLVVYDYILYAKKHNIYVGPGRGSSASSLVSYSLGIIDIDPLEYDLYFERFLNKDRKTMPDIDTDFDDRYRQNVIKYCIQKYGEDRVAIVSSYQTLLAKGTISFVSKVLDINELKVKAITKEIKSDDNSIESLMNSRVVLNYYKNDNEIKELLDISRKIEGVPKSIGLHASAVIISDESIYNYTEAHLNEDNLLVTTYNADTLKDIGLVKMDFLSLSTLSTISEIVGMIKENRGIDININNIPLDDNKTFKLFNEKPITGVFQFETPGMSEVVKKMVVSNFKELSIAIAIYRPGAISYAKEYINRKNKITRVEYYDPCLKDILSETLGIIVYQEQLMAICAKYSSLTLAEADILRRAISKKDEKLLLELKEKFFLGAEKNKRDKRVTEKLFGDILKFANYGFNKAHSIAYSKLSYITAYLKANYKEEFMAFLLRNNSSKLIKECRTFNLKVLPPDIRYSRYRYRISGNNLLMPLSSIKGIGLDYSKTIEKIVAESDKTFESIISKSKGILPRGMIEDLILANSFDYTGYNKKTMIEALDGLYDFDPTVVRGLKYKIKVQDEYPFEYLKSREFELLGFNPKYHPLKAYSGDKLKISDIEMGKEVVNIIGYLTDLKTLKTKTGDTMAHFYIEDEFLACRGVLFSSDYYKCAHFLKNNTIYEISGTYNLNRGEPQFIVRTIKKVENV